MSTAEIVIATRKVPWKRVRKAAKRLVPLALALLLIPKILAAYLIFGLLDIRRNRQLSRQLFEQYFVGNGLLTWLLAPFNLLMDLLTLPFRNRGVYQLDDLPPAYREEISSLIQAASRSRLVEQLQERVEGQDRVMQFFKWYGKNIPTSFDVPEFHRSYKYIRTIGVSVFNKQRSTSKHFGPLRVTLRVLYNINTIDDRNAFIQVGNLKHHWCDNKLLIFDDTLQHESHNDTDRVRYCMFIDILRPSCVPALTSAIVTGLRIILLRIRYVFYRNWNVIK